MLITLLTRGAKLPFGRLVMDDRVEALNAFAFGVIVLLHAQRIRIGIGTRLGIEAWLAEFLSCNKAQRETFRFKSQC